MATLPKTSAEILAAAKKLRFQPRKLEPDFKTHLSMFSVDPSADTSYASTSLPPQSQPTTSNVNSIGTYYFNDPITPQTLEAAVKLKETKDVEFEEEDLLDDVPADTWAFTSEPESPTDSISSSQSRMSTSDRILDVLTILRHYRLSPFDLVLEILAENNTQYSFYRNEFYKEGSDKLSRFLDTLSSSESGKRKLRTWIRKPTTVDLFCTVVTEEMNAVQKAELLPGIAAITPEFIRKWTVSSHQELAPSLQRILFAAAQTSAAKEKNKKKKPDMLCDILLKQLSYQRSNHSLGFPTVFGLFLWATGSARQTIDALHKCGLLVAYTSVLNAISSLATQCVELAVNVGSDIHVFCYDNVNISTSIFVEQRGASSPAKVTSGTFAVLYKVRNGNPQHMLLAPIIERFKQVKGLTYNNDLDLTEIQRVSFHFQLETVVIRVLTKYVKGFESYSKDLALQHNPRRAIPKGYVTEQFPLRATTIEEATVRGNLLFHDDIYVTQLRRPFDELSKYAIPLINDQLTNSRIRSGQILRARDSTPWERREVFQLGFGLFHLCLNLVWALLHVHRGSIGEPGSLTRFFTLLDKTRLGGEHPDYHTLLAALTQIFDGLILNTWRLECGQKSLPAFVASQPSPKHLRKIASTIILKHATPLDKVEKEEEDDSGDEERIPQAAARPRHKPPVPPIVVIPAKLADPEEDKVHQNIQLLTRDLLYLSEVIHAVSDGDIGRIEDFLPKLAKMFRGAGSNNYCAEILHFILNLKYVWTPEFADIMRDNMLVNISGLEGHSMPIDLNMEHLIGQLKDLLTAKGLESTWDQLGDISAAIDYFNKIKKKVSLTLGSTYQGSTHCSPDTSHLIWRVADTVRDDKIQIFKENREGNSKVKAAVDILATGEAKLRSSSIATFNRKICAMVNGLGHNYEDEEDTIPPSQLSLEEPALDEGNDAN